MRCDVIEAVFRPDWDGRTLMTRGSGFPRSRSAACLPAFAQNEALRGKMAMSVYVSVYGDNEINSAEFRLSLEQQLHDMGITVLPHGDPPNFPVLNLTINVSTSIVRTTLIYWTGARRPSTTRSALTPADSNCASLRPARHRP